VSQFNTSWYLTRLAKSQKVQQADCNEGVAREADLHGQITAECKAKGWLAFHGSMAHRTKRTEGEPDFTILADGGRVFFIECKRKGGKLSSDQQAVKAWAKKLGHEVHTVFSIEQFRAITTL